ncbi:MAG: tRNA(Ile)-lysidine synthase [Bacteroidetes bacterium ADurb.Bin408]|nr:MAG: tRNA(Ile)-lysidine synthase [Bacteroidetes bacterium ADurb.Bin408]
MQFNTSCHIIRFNTHAYAERNRISVQMAARELRYKWFRELLKQKKCTCVALAHHKDDAAETFLINLIRGTGIAGLHGIREKQGAFIRPLLFASRKEIETFANEKGIVFREDSSNSEDKYLRNKIRHHILPVLEDLNPSIRDSLSDTINYIAQTENLYKQYIEKLKDELLIKKGKTFYISTLKLSENNGAATLLYELIKPFGFNSAQTHNIFSILDAPPGKVFFSPTHTLLKDRDSLIISPINKQTYAVYSVENQNWAIENDLFKIEFSLVPGKNINPRTYNKNIIYLNAKHLNFPLTLRKWKQGDTFMPLGMKKMKKISDFLIDNKVSVFEKENIYVLVSSDQIAAVIGHRPDERFKVTKNSADVIKIDFSRKN